MTCRGSTSQKSRFCQQPKNDLVYAYLNLISDQTLANIEI